MDYEMANKLHRHGLTRKQIATALGIDPASLDRLMSDRRRERAIERAKNNPRHDWLPPDDEANINGNDVPRPEEIIAECERIRMQRYGAAFANRTNDLS